MKGLLRFRSLMMRNRCSDPLDDVRLVTDQFELLFNRHQLVTTKPAEWQTRLVDA